MRRIAAITVLLAGVAALVSLVSGSSAQGSSQQRFDVVFDDARGLIGGQLVKVAGATAGTIEKVSLDQDFKARIQANIDSKFFPFHQDATCTIRPQGLIAENYVECDPGTANSPVLKGSGGHPPTVPVDRTTEPVNLLDLFNIFNLPTRERFMVIADELGIGSSGRGQDFNDILRRANPALGLARQVIGILARQKAQLATIIDATNTIATEGAGNTASLQSFLDHAAAVATETANHRGNLALAINRLPGLLAAAQPSLQELDTVAVQGTPLVQQLGAAAPTLNQVNTDLGPFVAAAKPALAQLSAALKKAIPEIYAITPVVKTLRSYVQKSKANTILMGKLFVNLQRHGFTENFLSGFYYLAALTARFNAAGHIAPTFTIQSPAGGQCSMFSTTPVPGCSAHFGETSTYTPTSAASSAKPEASRRALSLAPAAGRTSSTSAAQAPARPSSPAMGATGQSTLGTLLPGLLQRNQHLAKQLIAKLLQRGAKVDPQAIQQLQSLLTGAGPPSDQSLQSLVGYLLR